MFYMIIPQTFLLCNNFLYWQCIIKIMIKKHCNFVFFYDTMDVEIKMIKVIE